MRKVISLRKLDAAERQEQEAILDLYLMALGMQLSMDFLGYDEPVKPAKAKKTARAKQAELA